MALANQGEFRGVTPRLLPMLIHPSRTEEEALTGIVTGMAERVGKDAFLRQQTAIMGRPDSRGDLPGISSPTLVLCGRQDALSTLEMHVEMADLIPRARLAVIEECGHLATLERPFAATALRITSSTRRWRTVRPSPVSRSGRRWMLSSLISTLSLVAALKPRHLEHTYQTSVRACRGV